MTTTYDAGMMAIAVHVKARPHDDRPTILMVPLHTNIAYLRDTVEFPRVRMTQGAFGPAWVEEHLIGADR